jgi:hypothetical protein
MQSQQKTHHFNLEHAPQHTQVESSDLICVELPESTTSGLRWQLAPHVQLLGLKLLQQRFSSADASHKGTRTFIFCPTGDQPHASLEFFLQRPSGLDSNTVQYFNLNVDIKKTFNA